MRNSTMLAGLAVTVLLLSGCGSDSEPVDTAASASAAPTLAATGNGGGMGLGGASADDPAFAEFQACLDAAGVTLPERGTGTGTRPTMSAEQQAAFDDCRELMPEATGTPGGMTNSEEFAAFTTCMEDQGVNVELPDAAATPGARPSGGTGGGSGMFGLDREDPEVAAALEICEVLLPQRAAASS